MVRRPEPPDASTISRREAIRRAAILTGVALSPAWLAFADRSAAAAQTAYLTPGQAALVAAIADRIIPRTDSPGASDVAVPAFIDQFYGECLTDEERLLLVSALEAVERASVAAHRVSFVALDPAPKDGVLQTVARSGVERDQEAFRLIRSVTVLGYFTSEEVGRHVLHFEPVPGRYDACIPIAEVGNRNWTT